MLSSICVQGEVGRQGVLVGSGDGLRPGDRVAAHGVVLQECRRVASYYGPGCVCVCRQVAGVISLCGTVLPRYGTCVRTLVPGTLHVYHVMLYHLHGI
jgi:hypothetical protein